MFYILQSLNVLILDLSLPFNLSFDNLKYILCKDCKVKYLALDYCRNDITLLKDFLINNETLEYLFLGINLETNIDNINLLCNGLSKNNHLTFLRLGNSYNLSYNDLIQVINSSKSITNYDFSYNELINKNNYELFLNTLMNNTIITNLYMKNIKFISNNDDTKLFNKDLIINLLKNNKTIEVLYIFDKHFIKSNEDIFLEGLKYNNTLIDLGV